ncbi:hypothetical protein [Microbacterium laevaniformans]|uniref:hypothetical protein n=1 Tax=Microbacterium laevaniformans TaxID=36807 RepID=UPI003D962A24
MPDVNALVAHADDAFDAVRAMNHGTIWESQYVAPPTPYRLLGNLSTAGGHGLAQLLGQLADRLDESAARDDLYDAEGGDPGLAAATAVALLRDSAERARAVGVLLDRAQSAVASVGVRD